VPKRNESFSANYVYTCVDGKQLLSLTTGEEVPEQMSDYKLIKNDPDK
jgi:hypothetical protein